MNHEEHVRKAERMRGSLKDYLDQPNHAQARQAMQHLDVLIGDLKQKKSRETIDSRLRTLIAHLQRVEEEVMDFQHSNLLVGLCEDMRSSARNL